MSKVRIRHGDNEIEVDGSVPFIQKQLSDFYAHILETRPQKAAPSVQQVLMPTPQERRTGKAPTPAEFYKSKGKTDGISQVLIFAKYLEDFKNILEFTQKEVNAVAKEAKIAKDIHSQYFTNAVKQGLLRAHSDSKYSLTLSAEEILAAM